MLDVHADALSYRLITGNVGMSRKTVMNMSGGTTARLLSLAMCVPDLAHARVY